MEIQRKIKYPVTLEKLVKLAFPNKSKKFRDEFYFGMKGKLYGIGFNVGQQMKKSESK